MREHETAEISAGHTYLECPRWHDGKLWLSDTFRKSVIRLAMDGTHETVVEVAGAPAGIGFLQDGSLLVVSKTDKKLLRVEGDGTVSTYADLSAIAGGPANDMLVTPEGHAYVGNHGFNVLTEDPRPTHLAHVRPDRTVSEVPDEVLFPNGCGLTVDGQTMLLAETYAHHISAFDVAADGNLSGHRVWALLPESHRPDGIAVDVDGGVWYANVLSNGPDSGFYRVVQGGEITDFIPVVQGWAVACAFGGDENDILFLVCNDTSLAEYGAGRSNGSVRAARVGRRGA